MNPQRKILIVTPTFGKFGGIEAMVLNLAKKIKQEGTFQVRVCFKRAKGFNVSSELQDIFNQAEIPFIKVQRAGTDLWHEIKQADLIHAQNVSPDVVFFSKVLKKPLLLHIHHWCRRNFTLHSILWRLCIQAADYKTFVSQFVWGTWEPHGHKSNSRCIPSVPELTSIPVNFSKRKGFIFISRWIKNKGLRTLLQAYQHANINKSEWPLTLIGDGPLKAWVHEYLEKHPMPSVSCLGFVDQKEKAKRIALSKWLVAPPNTNEDLGMTPIEARYLSVPCIVSRDGGIPEAAGPSAFLCDPGSIESLQAQLEHVTQIDESKYREISKNGKATLDQFIQDPLEYIHIYRSLLYPTLI